MSELCHCVSQGGDFAQGRCLMVERNQGRRLGYVQAARAEITVLAAKSNSVGVERNKAKALLWCWVPKNSHGWAPGGASRACHVLSLVLRGVPVPAAPALIASCWETGAHQPRLSLCYLCLCGSAVRKGGGQRKSEHRVGTGGRQRPQAWKTNLERRLEPVTLLGGAQVERRS